MYEKDKRQRVTVRLNDEQFECVRSKSELLGISPSDFMRMLINSVMYVERKEGGLGRENDKADKHDII